VFEKILVPLDGSELSESILSHVKRLVLVQGTRVILVHVLREPTKDGHEKRHLERVAETLARHGAHVETRVLGGEPADAILALALEVRPSLIALSTHGRTGVERWVRGSVAERLLQRATFPLLLVNPFATGAHSFKKILVALDGSQQAARILPFVHDIARTFESEVILAHALAVPTDLERGEPLALAATEKMTPQLARAQDMLAGFAKQLGGVAVRREVVWGSPAAALLELGEREKADLFALTTHGSSVATRWLYGSVAEHLLHHVAAPLLVLR